MNIDAERKQLLKRDAEWSVAAAAGEDVDRILSFWTDDAVVMAPGLPSIKGKASLRAYVESSLKVPGFKIEWESDDVELSPDGGMAYMFSRNRVSMIGPDGTPTVSEGRAVTIWRRETDNEWRCCVDIWNTEA